MKGILCYKEIWLLALKANTLTLMLCKQVSIYNDVTGTTYDFVLIMHYTANKQVHAKKQTIEEDTFFFQVQNVHSEC